MEEASERSWAPNEVEVHDVATVKPSVKEGQVPAPSIADAARVGNYKWKVLTTVMIGTVMIILDSTVVNVAFRTLQLEFGGNLAASQWVLSIYVLALGISTPVSGYLGDRFGIKRIYLFGLGLFAFGSLMCGLAPTLGVLIAMRALQGIGGGMAQPLGPAMIYRRFPPKEQGFALGIFGISLAVAPALGPILGGLLVDANLWRLIFFINVPIGIIAVLVGNRFLHEGAAEKKPLLDVPGLILSIVAFGSLLFAATNAQSNGFTGPLTLGSFTVGTIALLLFGYVELFVAREPLLELRLFKSRVFANATFIGYVSVLALFGAEFLLPLYLQQLRGLTALETGLVLIALAVTSGIVTPIAGRLYDKIGPRVLVTGGFAILVVNTWQLAQITSDTPIKFIVLLLALRGLAFGLTVQSTFTTALGNVPLPLLPRGSSLTNSTRFVVQAVAVAILATLLSSALLPQIQQLAAQMQESTDPALLTAHFGLCETPGVASADNLPPGTSQRLAKLPAAQQAQAKQQIRSTLQEGCSEYTTGFERAYTMTFIFSIISVIISAFLPGWPGKWAGRGAHRPAVAGGH
jgi:DHA2 family multidrug resistance protein